MKNSIRLPRVMLAAPSSGGGKTTAICALLKALEMRGVKASACKCGPDYIDPMFHRKVMGVPSVNLDLFFSDAETVKYLMAQNARNSDITVIEGVMGYYDGMSMSGAEASSYDIARKTGTPVILVMPCRGAAYTLAAVIRGIAEFKSDSNIQGIILNNISEMTYKALKGIIEKETGIRVAGFLPRLDNLEFKSRHLGLVTPQDAEGVDKILEHLGKTAIKTLDLDMIFKIAAEAPDIEVIRPEIKEIAHGIKIGIAYDKAFCFYYSENIELLEEMGCEIKYFSPINDTELPEEVDGLILGGGYPELYAKELSENISMLDSVRKAIRNGIPCIAECGGFMYLHEYFEDDDKNEYKGVGVIEGKAFKTDKLVRFGYIDITANESGVILNKGENIRGHEFHYWDSTNNGCSCTAAKPSGTRKWECVHSGGSLFAGFPHVYFYSNQKAAANFINACMRYSGKKHERIHKND